MKRDELIGRVLRAVGDRAAGVSAEALAEHLADWELFDAAGAVIMRRGAEMHVAAVPEARRRWFGKEARALLRDTLARYGRIETLVMKDHEPGHAFARRLGFEPVGDSGAAIRYELRTLRHA